MKHISRKNVHETKYLLYNITAVDLRDYVISQKVTIFSLNLTQNYSLEKPEYAAYARLPGRGASVVTFALIFVYTAEVYPTTVRSTGLGYQF